MAQIFSSANHGWQLVYQPNDSDKHCNHYENESSDYTRNKEPFVRSCTSEFGSGVALEELSVFRVTPKPNGENVPEDRNGADDCIQRDIDPHAQQYDFGKTKLSCNNENRRACDAREGISDTRNESQDRIQAYSDRGPGDGEPLVQQIS